jgi:hypothetical protein
MGIHPFHGAFRSTAERRKKDHMKRLMMAALAAVTAFTTLFIVAGAAGPAAAATGSGCPGNKVLGSVKTATNVAADFSNSGSTTTYKFYSLTDENPVGGVPGLMKYCVYPTPPSQPSATHVDAKGANGAAWVSAKGSNNFAFVRPGGNKTNIPLDGKTTTMGTATWSSLPDSQKIILHIADPTTCTSLYGSGTSGTCFVKPSAPPVPCSTGDANVAYNSVVSDVMACPPLDDEAFQATQTNEFGDAVGLAGTGNLQSITVTFRSWGCGDSGHWYSGDCVTSANQSFSSTGMDLRAHIYDTGGNVIATSDPYTGTIPFRPSADSTHCQNPGIDANGGDDTGKWYDAAANLCLNAVPVQIPFTFPTAVAAPSQVIWTVSFNTSGFGDSPFGYSTACATSGIPAGTPGCGYDSLNVGAWTYTNAPYSGTDLNADQLYHSTGNPPGPLAVQSGQTGRTPLAEITIG